MTPKKQDKYGTSISKGDFVRIIPGDNAKGDITRITEMVKMSRTGRLYKIEDIDINMDRNKTFIYIHGWWFESIYIVKYVESNADIHLEERDPVFFDVNSLLT